MKRQLTLVLSVLMLLLTACGKEEAVTVPTPSVEEEISGSEETTTEEPSSVEETPSPTITTEPVAKNKWYDYNVEYDYVHEHAGKSVGLFLPDNVELRKASNNLAYFGIKKGDPDYVVDDLFSINLSHISKNHSFPDNISCLQGDIVHEDVVQTAIGEFKSAIVDMEIGSDYIVFYTTINKYYLVVYAGGKYSDGTFTPSVPFMTNDDYTQLLISLFDENEPFELKKAAVDEAHSEGSEEESTMADDSSAAEDATEANKATSGGYILLADGTKVSPGETINLSEFDSATFVVETGNSEQVWYAAVACLGPYYIKDDPEPNWAYEAKTSDGNSIALSNYKWLYNDPAYDYFCMELRGVSSFKDYEINFKVAR